MHPILWTPIIPVVLLAAVIDIHCRRIPNWLTVPSLLAGLAANCAVYGWAGLERGFGGIAAAVVVVGALCFLGGMGMGDLKLAAAVGAWTGAPALLFSFVITAMAGGVMAVVYALWKRRLGEAFSSTASILSFGGLGAAGHPRTRVTDPDAFAIPYAPAIAIGVIVSSFAN
jgi:prepilin peptidase CpaA